jgi:hypothetical protein
MLPAMRRRFGLSLLLVVLGCQTAPTVDLTGRPHNASPFADPGTGGRYLLGATLALDGGRSFDPDGQVRAYRWELVVQPPHSAPFAVTTATTASYPLATAGTYTFRLTVTDDAGATDAKEVTFIGDAPALVVDVGPSTTAPWRHVIHLTGTYSVEPTIPVTLQWQLLAVPAGSVASLTGPGTLTPSFFADVLGDYVIRLTVTTPYSSQTATLTITAIVPRLALSYQAIDAAYATARDRLVLVSDAPPQLHVLDPVTNTETTVALPATPTSLSLEPGGARAAIAHGSQVTVVDLTTTTLLGTYPLPTTIAKVVFAGGNRVLASAGGYNPFPLYTIALATGAVTLGNDYRATMIWGRLHPSQRAAYFCVENSAFELLRYDTTTTPATYLRDNTALNLPAGDLWFTADGASIVTTNGNVFISSDLPALDMTLRLNLGRVGVRGADDAPSLGRIAVARTVFDQFYQATAEEVVEYDDQTFAALQTIPLPVQATFVAFRADASKLYVLANTAATSTLFVIDP